METVNNLNVYPLQGNIPVGGSITGVLATFTQNISVNMGFGSANQYFDGTSSKHGVKQIILLLEQILLLAHLM